MTVLTAVMDVLAIVVESGYPDMAGGLSFPVSPHQKHPNPAPIVRNLAETKEPAPKPKAWER